MGPKRTQYERCRKALNAFDLVRQLCNDRVNEIHISVHSKLQEQFDEVLHDVAVARRRFEKARIRVSTLNNMGLDPFWDVKERDYFQQLEKIAIAELNAAEEEWNDI